MLQEHNRNAKFLASWSAFWTRMRSIENVLSRSTENAFSSGTFNFHRTFIWKDNIVEVISVGYNFQAMFCVFRLVDVLTEETNEKFISNFSQN